MEGEIIVAKKKTGIAVCFIAFIVLGVILLAIGGVMYAKSEMIQVLLIMGVVGLVLVGLGIFVTVNFFKMPKAVIVYRDGVLYMPKGFTCTPDEVNHILVTVRSYYGIANKWGKLTLTINGTKHHFNYIDQIQDAADTLSEIKNEYMQSVAQAQFMPQTEEKEETKDEQPAQPEANEKSESDDPFENN